ncbi:MAG: PQQ-like beta-propeller repeat protein [Chloroflexota bacterium]|nr:PQQ-like beta-propeller repeat protein [Chloroflexota bacterium]
MPRVSLRSVASKAATALAALALAGALVGLHMPAAAANPLPTGDWPMYGHDPARTNFNPAETTINRGTEPKLQQLWQANIGSNGTPPSGAPSVANGRVYVASSTADGPNFFAFDAVTGVRAWTAGVGHIEVGCFNVGVGATPAIAGDTVIAGGGDAAYYGLDAATGAQRWRQALNVGSSGFPWASPLVSGDRAYLGVASRCDDPSVRGELRAVNTASGALQANVYFASEGNAGAGIWNSPALSPDGNTLVAATGEDFRGVNGPYTRAIVTLDPVTLQIRQVDKEGATGADLDYGSTPVIFHDASGRVLTGANHKDGTFYAFVLDKVGSGPLWSRATGTAVGMMPAYDPTVGDGGTLFIAAKGLIYAVDPATGKDRYPRVNVGQTHGNMALASGLIFANTGSAGLQVLDEATGAHLRTLQPSNAGAAYSGVAVSNGVVYWLSGSELNAWGLPSSPATPASTPAASPTAGTGFADQAFNRLWSRTDSLVANHSANRSWLWGPAPITGGLNEAYAEGRAGLRLVQYFDKSRMEISHPEADPKSAFYVTNGLLVVELISGRLQVGDHSYETRSPSTANVAGDVNDTQAPTYKSFVGVANTTLGDHKAPDRTGRTSTATLDRTGTAGDDPSKSRYSGLDFVHYEASVGHNIPRIFWDFLNKTGPVAENGQAVQGPLSSPWFYASGLPISEPYWTTVRIAGVPTDVLVQCYERRVLTYTPSNPAAFRVEIGNVGQHYYSWRYKGG